MSAEVSIEYDVVDKMANTFNQAGETFNGIAQGLNGAAALLQATGFAGLIGMVSQILLESMSQSASNIGSKCSELGTDLKGAIDALKNGDTSGAQRFAN
ncbi:MAG: hypothetical protein U0528_15560 [Anaerolineae bacterium]|nr:hypothetical protein [Anaerolineae bacterium]